MNKLRQVLPTSDRIRIRRITAFASGALLALTTFAPVFSGTASAFVPVANWTDVGLASAKIGVSYSDGVESDGTGAAYSLNSGDSLPAGLSINATTGAITGTPTVAGEFFFGITAENEGGDVSAYFHLRVEKHITNSCPTIRCVLGNGHLRFGNGTENSVDEYGTLRQPFYWSSSEERYEQMTYDYSPFKQAIGSGTNGSNWSGNTVQDFYSYEVDGGIPEPLENQVILYDDFTVTGVTGSISIGYGTIVSSGEMTINGQRIRIINEYTLGVEENFVQVVTSIRNISGSSVSNLNVWVGGSDDYIGYDEWFNFNEDFDASEAMKLRVTAGEPDNLASPEDPASILAERNQNSGAAFLFYSAEPGVNVSFDVCCEFARAYNADPTTSPDFLQDDNSYAVVLPFGDIADNAEVVITWSYGASSLYDLDQLFYSMVGGGQSTAPTEFTDYTLALATVGSLYSDGVEADGNPAPTYAVDECVSPVSAAAVNELPAGLTLNPDTGAITGTPSAAGTYNFCISATNTEDSITEAFQITVSAANTPTTTTTVAPTTTTTVARATTTTTVAPTTTTTTPKPVFVPVLAPTTADGTPITPPLGSGFIRDANGVPSPVKMAVVGDKVSVGTADFNMQFDLSKGEAKYEDKKLTFVAAEPIVINGVGFAPGSIVEVWLFSTPTLLGTAVVKADGTFSIAVSVPDAIVGGNHTVQAEGLNTAGQPRSISAPVILKTAISAAQINFDSNSSRLDTTAQAALNAYANRVKTSKFTKVSVTGYTDALGSSAFNISLSKARADAVAAYLKLKLQGYKVAVSVSYKGKADPIDPNNNSVGRANNRRVELVSS